MELELRQSHHPASRAFVDLEPLVERGGRLVACDNTAALTNRLSKLGAKIALIGKERLRVARQLEFLADFVHAGARASASAARNEALFALLYAANDADLIADHLPGIGFADEEGVCELVLQRHAEVFERHCAARGLPWHALKPKTAEDAARLLLSSG